MEKLSILLKYEKFVKKKTISVTRNKIESEEKKKELNSNETMILITDS